MWLPYRGAKWVDSGYKWNVHAQASWTPSPGVRLNNRFFLEIWPHAAHPLADMTLMSASKYPSKYSFDGLLGSSMFLPKNTSMRFRITHQSSRSEIGIKNRDHPKDNDGCVEPSTSGAMHFNDILSRVYDVWLKSAFLNTQPMRHNDTPHYHVQKVWSTPN